MAAEVRPIQQYRPPPGPSPLTPDQRYWASFKSHQLLPSPSSAPVTALSHSAPTSLSSTILPASSSSDTHLIATTTGSRVQLYTTRGTPYPKLLRTITTRLSDPTASARSATLRRDGRVLVAASDTGALQVYDTTSRAILKTWTQHKQPAWTAQWSPHQGELTQLMSCSDDRTVRTWELSENDPINTFHGHQDYVRAGAYLSHPSVLVSGSYDATVRIWDMRAPAGQSHDRDKAVMTFAFKEPVESVLPLSTGAGTSLLSASGNTVHVLDLVAARSITILKAHQKTVTSLSTASAGTRVLTGGLDGHLKIWDTSSWQVVAGRKYDSQILAASVVPSPPASASTEKGRTDRHLLVGLSSGILSIRTRLPGEVKAKQKTRDAEMAALAAGTIDEHDRKQSKKRKLTQGMRARFRGVDYDGYGAQLVVEDNPPRSNKKKLPLWDHLMRKLEYTAALEEALQLRDGAVVLTCLKALVHRSALNTAVRGMAQNGTLEVLMMWLRRHVCDPREVELLSRVGMLATTVWCEGVGEREMREAWGTDARVGDWEEREQARIEATEEAGEDAKAESGDGEERTAEDAGGGRRQGKLELVGAGGGPWPDEWAQAKIGKGAIEGEKAVRSLHRAVREQVDCAQEAMKTLGMLGVVGCEVGML